MDNKRLYANLLGLKEPGAHFAALFESLAVDWLNAASTLTVARRLHLSWDDAAGIQKRREYVTIVSDLELRAR